MCKLHKVSKGLCSYVPLIPTTPHTAAGIRIDPPPSVPKATGHRPEKNRIIKNSHWLLPFVIEQTIWEVQQVILKKKRRKNSDSLMGIELMTPDLTLSQEVLDYE